MSSQIEGLLKKNYQLMKRQKASIVCQVKNCVNLDYNTITLSWVHSINKNHYRNSIKQFWFELEDRVTTSLKFTSISQIKLFK